MQSDNNGLYSPLAGIDEYAKVHMPAARAQRTLPHVGGPANTKRQVQ